MQAGHLHCLYGLCPDPRFLLPKAKTGSLMFREPGSSPLRMDLAPATAPPFLSLQWPHLYSSLGLSLQLGPVSSLPAQDS
jgi:hypothetical protein